MRGHWFWRTYAAGQLDILLVDLLFPALAVVSGLVLVKMRQRARATQPLPGVQASLTVSHA